jgi:NAD(P)-dependent dehydrogenase (short-subunit alcohol dehydrogenase family)
MEVRDKIVVVTGAGSGIGRALCHRFAVEGARAVVVSDRNEALAKSVAAEIGGNPFKTDVAIEADLKNLVQQVTTSLGPIDLFCSNAGIILNGGPETSDADWERIWHVNVMSHVYAARAVLPAMLARGQGYLLQTASAAGLLTQLGSAPYSVTKHAAVGFAEWLSITHAAAGIKVSCLCPQGVRTEMLDLAKGGIAEHLRETALDPSDVAESVIAGLKSERFLILPHAEVADFFKHKADDYERWLRGMRRLQDRFGADL